MSFNIILYQNKSPNNKVDKTLEEVAAVKGTFKTPTSYESPQIVVRGMQETFLYANYLYIEPWKRWYFIGDRISLTTHLTQLNCSVDVLMTYRKEIRANEVIIARNAYDYDLYLPDNQWVTHQKTVSQILTGEPEGDANLEMGYFVLDVFGPNAEVDTTETQTAREGGAIEI